MVFKYVNIINLPQELATNFALGELVFGNYAMTGYCVRQCSHTVLLVWHIVRLHKYKAKLDMTTRQVELSGL